MFPALLVTFLKLTETQIFRVVHYSQREVQVRFIILWNLCSSGISDGHEGSAGDAKSSAKPQSPVSVQDRGLFLHTHSLWPHASMPSHSILSLAELPTHGCSYDRFPKVPAVRGRGRRKE